MCKNGGLLLALGLVAVALGGGKSLVNVPKFDGKFIWLKLGGLPADASKTLSHAKSILLDVSFPRDVKLKKDKNGVQWFSIILADQGTDSKWHQTTGGAVLPVSAGTIKAGKYTVSIPVSGIPSSVLGNKIQTISLGPSTSGLANPISFSIDHLRGR